MFFDSWWPLTLPLRAQEWNVMMWRCQSRAWKPEDLKKIKINNIPTTTLFRAFRGVTANKIGRSPRLGPAQPRARHRNDLMCESSASEALFYSPWIHLLILTWRWQLSRHVYEVSRAGIWERGGGGWKNKTKEKKPSRSRRRAPPFGPRQAGNSCVWANEAACSRSQWTSWLRHGPAGGGGESAKPCVQSSCRAGGGRMGVGRGDKVQFFSLQPLLGPCTGCSPQIKRGGRKLNLTFLND